MVKTHDVMKYLKDGIGACMVCDEECTYVDAEYLEETNNSFEVEFIDYTTENNDKTKYRITVENID